MKSSGNAEERLGSARTAKEAKVVVVLLNWNRWQDTLECLHSLAALTYGNCELVVVDNGSSDGSVARVREAFPRIKLFDLDTNLGFGGGNNVGLRYALEAGADYVWFLNNDTKVHPSALSAMAATAESDPRIGAVGAALYYRDNPGRIQAWGGGRLHLWGGIARLHKRRVPDEKLDFLTAASVLLRRQALENVGGFDEGFFLYWEDIDLCLRLRSDGWKLGMAADAIVWHRESASLRDRTHERDVHFIASAVRFFRKHASFPALPIALAVALSLGKRLLRGEWKRAMAVLRGLRIGVALPLG